MDNFESVMPEKKEEPAVVEPMVTPVEEKMEEKPMEMPMETMTEKPKAKKNGTNIFMAVLISVVIILLLSVAGWFLARKYIWQPQQSYVENQFKTLDLKIQDLNAELEAERTAAEDTMEVLKEMEALLEDMKAEEEKDPSEIEAYMMEEFEVPADWQTYKNDDWGIEFQYPADWEANLEGEHSLMLELAGNNELRKNWEGDGPVFEMNPYFPKVIFTHFKEASTKEDLISGKIVPFDIEKQEEIIFNEYPVYPLYFSVGEVSSYSFYLENMEGIKFNYDIQNNYEVQDMQTELNILKTLKFTK